MLIERDLIVPRRSFVEMEKRKIGEIIYDTLRNYAQPDKPSFARGAKFIIAFQA